MHSRTWTLSKYVESICCMDKKKEIQHALPRNRRSAPSLQERRAQHQQLGGYVAQYGERYIVSPAGILVVCIGIGILCASAVLVPLLATFLPAWQTALLPLIGFGWTTVGWWLLSSLPPFRGKTVTLYEQGMLCSEKGRCEVMLWHEVGTIWLKTADTTGVPQYEVQRIDGYVFRFERTFPCASQLLTILEREVMHRLFAHCLDRYRRGQSITFGALRINQQGISVEPHKHILPWLQVKYIDAYNDVVSIRLKHHSTPIASIPLSAIPNVCVLESLIRHIHRTHREIHLRQVQLIPKRPSSSFYRSSATWDSIQQGKEVTCSLTTSS